MDKDFFCFTACSKYIVMVGGGGSKEREVCEDERSTRSDRFAEMVGSVIVHFSIGHQGGQLCLYYVKLLLISASPS